MALCKLDTIIFYLNDKNGCRRKTSSKRVQDPRNRIMHFMPLLLLSLGGNFGIFLKIFLCFLFLVSADCEADEISDKWKITFPVQCDLPLWYHCLWSSTCKIAEQSLLPLTSFNPFFRWSIFPYNSSILCYTQVQDFKIIDPKADCRNPCASLQHWLLPGHIHWWQLCTGGHHILGELDADFRWVGGRCRIWFRLRSFDTIS